MAGIDPKIEEMIAVLGPAMRAEAEKMKKEEALKVITRTCPRCGKSHKGNEVKDFCPDCGTAYSATSLICPKCNAENDIKFKYCTGCSAKLK